MDYSRWAEEEFGTAELGDPRRTRRLVALSAEVAGRPSGVVTEACDSAASREGAFRFLENDAVHVDAIRLATHAAAARRCAGEDFVYVAVDGSALTLSDPSRKKELGGVGAWNKSARGVHAMSALAVSRDGTTLGLCGQRMWTRTKPSPHGHRGAGGSKRSENRYWNDVIEDVTEAFERHAGNCRPWFQLDRGGDAWHVLSHATQSSLMLTVRAAHDRHLQDESHLWQTLRRQKVRAIYEVNVPARKVRTKKRVDGKRIFKTHNCRSRTARATVRAATVTLKAPLVEGKGCITLNAVLVREDGRRRNDHVEWMLLTTQPVRTKSDVLAVVAGYAKRWSVEVFHRTWKSGFCDAEAIQLRSQNGIYKWATILATVATRALRLTKLARATPDAPASSEFSDDELCAIVALRKPKNVPDDLGAMRLADAVQWLASIGGHPGPWGKPPGAIVIGRGLYDILVAVRAIEYARKKR